MEAAVTAEEFPALLAASRAPRSPYLSVTPSGKCGRGVFFASRFDFFIHYGRKAYNNFKTKICRVSDTNLFRFQPGDRAGVKP